MSSSITLGSIALRQGLSLNWRLAIWAELAAQELMGSASLCSPMLGYRHMHLYWLFMLVLGIQIQVLRLAEQILVPTRASPQAPSHPLAPILSPVHVV